MRQRSVEYINKKCELLQSLGFEIEHVDSRVSFNGYIFDFSAVACDAKSIMFVALESMFEHGREQGQNTIKSAFKKLLDLD